MWGILAPKNGENVHTADDVLTFLSERVLYRCAETRLLARRLQASGRQSLSSRRTYTRITSRGCVQHAATAYQYFCGMALTRCSDTFGSVSTLRWRGLCGHTSKPAVSIATLEPISECGSGSSYVDGNFDTAANPRGPPPSGRARPPSACHTVLTRRDTAACP